jgi:multidrug transporter EmrE-like cation transporter
MVRRNIKEANFSVSLTTFMLVLSSVSLAAIAQILLRKAMLVINAGPPFLGPLNLILALLTNVFLGAGMVSYGLSLGLWLIVLSRLPVSIAYPMGSIGYILAAFIGVLFLGEPIGISRILGILLICVGVFVVARSA